MLGFENFNNPVERKPSDEVRALLSSSFEQLEGSEQVVFADLVRMTQTFFEKSK